MKAKLVSPASSSSEWEIELKQFPAVIGRSPHAQIQPWDSSVSGLHCELEAVNGRLLVRDLGSEYGTFINGIQVDIAPLLPGDKLTVGKSSFIASYDFPERHVPQPSLFLTERDVPPWDREVHSETTLFGLVELLDRQRSKFRKHNREPGQTEAMFPDPPHPEHVEHLLAEEMKTLGVDPRFIYAFEQTRILVTEFNQDSLTEDQLLEWRRAIEEYEELHVNSAGQQRYPVGAVTMYGPDKVTTTMIVAAVMTDEESEPIYQRWIGCKVKDDPQVKYQMTEFFRAYDVRSVICVRENVSCPHQEGLDYPVGQDCPFCPHWASS